MTYNPAIHHRRSIRLRENDYTQAGAYFVTACTIARECLFGAIVAGEMTLTAYMGLASKLSSHWGCLEGSSAPPGTPRRGAAERA